MTPARHAADIEDVYELSPLQQGILFHCLAAEDPELYVIRLSCRLEGPCDLAALATAWQHVVDRHPILRTSFHWEGLEKPVQLVHRTVALPVDQEDWRAGSAADNEQRLAHRLEEERRRGLSLDGVPLTRVTLIRLADDRAQLLWAFHHILLEGWSAALLLQEVLAAQEAISRGRTPASAPRRPYRDFIEWLQGQDPARAEAYWRETLRGFAGTTRLLPAASPDHDAGTARRESQEMALSKEATAGLQALAQGAQVTLNTVAQGAWAILLSRYRSEEDVTFGSVVSGRQIDLPGVESVVGLLVNTLVARVHVEGSERLGPWLRTLQQRQAQMREFEHSALVDVQRWSSLPASTPLFDTLFAFENWLGGVPLETGQSDLTIREVRVVEGGTGYPLSVEVRPGPALSAAFSYDTGRCDRASVSRLRGHYQALLEAMARRPEARLDDLVLVSPAERESLLVLGAGDHPAYPSGVGLAQLFEAQAARMLDAVAVEFGADRLTYRELNSRANRLAHQLIRHGVGPEVRVGICCERSADMVVGLLGILKAGGAYVPLDPSYPKERLAFMLADSRVAALVAQERTRETLPEQGPPVLSLDLRSGAAAAEDHANPAPRSEGANLAYVIYTSGSTGLPKGVAVTQAAVSRLVMNTDYAQIEASDRVAQASTASFDAATFEIWGALLNGARLVGIHRDVVLSPRDFGAELERSGVTTLFLTTALFNQVVHEDPLAFSSLRHLLFGGEAVDPAPVRAVLKAGRPRRLLHVYGPTETTTFATWHLVEDVLSGGTTVPIGRPIANTSAYVLDGHLEPVPVGVQGELYVGGDGLARGYLDQPALTAARFVPNPHALRPGERLYRTGDRVCLRPDGAIEFLGRGDNQVKIRGFRIEMGEIEAVLAEYPGVKDALVLAREDSPGDKRLVAYLTRRDGQLLDVAALRSHLKAKLPEYMTPAAFLVLDSLPLTPNGKVDREALPRPETSLAEAATVGPRNPVEEAIAAIWAEVLGLEQVGAHDNFFELGGHSLLATQVVSRLRDTFRIEMPLRRLFDAPTVAELGKAVEAARRGGGSGAPAPIAHAPRDGDLPLSFAQQRLWFLAQMESGSAYNIPWAMRLRGPLRRDALQASVNEIVRRHEALRTTFPARGGRPAQVIAPGFVIPFREEDLSHLPEAERERTAHRLATEELGRVMDVARGPLLSATLLRLGDLDHVVVLAIHHIVADGWSMGVLSRELTALYRAFSQGEPSPLEELPIQYADFSTWQRQWLQGEALDLQVAYWKRRLDRLPTLQIPTDRPRPAISTYRGAVHRFTLPRHLSEELRSLSLREGATLFMTLLAAFKVLLSRYSGQEDLVVGLPIANRDRRELEGLVGFFVNSLVLRTDLSGDPTFREALARVRETALEAYDHQALPFEKLVEELQPERDTSRNPLFQVAFALQNAPFAPLDLGELQVEGFEFQVASTRFDLELHLWESPHGLWGGITYSTALFDAATVKRFASHFETLLEGIVDDPDRRLSALPVSGAAERRQVLVEWNATGRDYPRDVCVHGLFERQVERSPEAVALVFEGESVTYRELNARANRLAHHLRSMGVGPEVRVGISVERSVEMVVGLLGILKAGGAYVPLDPGYPPSRLAFMLADAGTPVLLTQSRLVAGLPLHAARIVRLDEDWDTVARAPATDLPHDVSASNLAYVIYTSGSTGLPKGAMNSHGAVCNRLLWMQEEYGLTAADRVLQKTPFSFDVSVWEFFWPLMVGARLVVARPEGHKDREYLARLVEAEGVTTLHFVPSMLRIFLEGPESRGLSTLRRVVCSGEALPFDLQERFLSEMRAELHNLYGPTEAAVDVTYWACRRGDERRTVPIGRPVANTQVYVMDGGAQPVPVGVVGELYLGGAQVGRGYLHRPDLTAERFVPDPFGNQPGARLYKTGDLVRYRPDGALEYLGRSDHQVKVRGFRIELGEIESALAEHPAIVDSVVLAREDEPGDQRIVAYVVAAPLADVDAAAEAKQVSQWQALYDGTYGQEVAPADPRFNFVGWNSSYTGQPIPEAEMREWLEAASDRILASRPQRVLEIGCGTGLVMFRVAPSCARYVGTDFSRAAIDYLKRQGAGGAALPHAELRHGAADDFGGLEAGSFDAVILNSVVQYFPDVGYLIRVIEGALRTLAPGGVLFLGDLRSLPLLESYHASVQVHKAADSVSRMELRQRVRKQVAQEEELVLDPALFDALRGRFPQITEAVVLGKRGRHHNELTRFRYDVILRTGASPPLPVDGERLDWQAHRLTVEAIVGLLREREPETLRLSGIPNARLDAERRILEWLRSDTGPDTVGALREVLTALAEEGSVDPEALWGLGSTLPYDVEVGSPDADGRVQALLRRRKGTQAGTARSLARASAPAEPWTTYANAPLRGMLARQLVSQLRAFLEERLPAYMIPSTFVVLDALPLSPNGKVDRAALPPPEQARPLTGGAYVAPRTPVEAIVAAAFAQVLGIEQVGAHDGFFELGGHSLLATQVVSRLRDSLQVDVPLPLIFEASTAAGLAAALLADPERGERVAQIAEVLMGVAGLSDDEASVLASGMGMGLPA